MNYEMKVTNDGGDAILTFVRKSGEAEEIYLGFVGKEGMLADRVLSDLYDYHQMEDEFGPDDEMTVEGVGRFKILDRIHVVPADDDTKLAVRGLTRERPYRIAYSGVDGHDSTSFATLAEAAKYVRDRWQGLDYMESETAFRTDYANYVCFGFTLRDVGKVVGTTLESMTFEFNPELINDGKES